MWTTEISLRARKTVTDSTLEILLIILPHDSLEYKSASHETDRGDYVMGPVISRTCMAWKGGFDYAENGFGMNRTIIRLRVG